MINAVTNTGAVSPVGAATRPSVQETAVRHAAPAAAAAPHVATPASHESTVVTISAQAAHTAQAAQAASTHPTIAQATAKATVDQVKANAQRAVANPDAQPTAAPKPAAEPTAAPAPQIHGVYFSPVPAPLSLDPIPSQHLPAIAFSPADVNQDGHVSTSEAEAYSFHHEPTLAAQPGESAADLTAYTSIARS